MEIYKMENAVMTLTKHLKGATQIDHEIFFKYMEHLCDTESDFYILGNLQSLADTIKKYEAKYLIDIISLYDYKSAQALDVLVME
ncbi:hypothetical protein [Priestia megaterium]|uniref:hypothetical protein n=1 Tax=Priestia megaterium TaxID=1404 RepID=UPI0011B70552|nr:hypothetical protein [Priestia megaterium]QDZ83528.1 hypothetical protein D0441_03485 [Priestia megaterium]